MGAFEIITIIAAVLIVVAVVVTAVVRKLKGKPSLGSECCGCPYSKGCKGTCHCSTTNDNIDEDSMF